MGKIKGKSIIYKNILLIYGINEILQAADTALHLHGCLQAKNIFDFARILAHGNEQAYKRNIFIGKNLPRVDLPWP